LKSKLESLQNESQQIKNQLNAALQEKSALQIANEVQLENIQELEEKLEAVQALV
jgi:hypothetical protein